MGSVKQLAWSSKCFYFSSSQTECLLDFMQVSFTDKKLIHLFDLCAEYNATNVAHRYYLKFNGCKVSTKMCKIIEGICYSHFVNGIRNGTISPTKKASIFLISVPSTMLIATI